LNNEIVLEFKNHVIPFWQNLKDDEFGGYFGLLNYNLDLDKKSEKGCILNSRILWFFSNAKIRLVSNEYIKYADHAYDFLVNKCMDKKYGGVYWSLNYDGSVKDDNKHTYNQAFAIYALSAYYEATGNNDALKHAFDLFELIEGKCRDKDGYLECFTFDFKPAGNDKLSENGVEAKRTMNTLLHVLESYTELFKVSGDYRVKRCIEEILNIFAQKVYDYDEKRLKVFFDEKYNTLIDLYSYGHDIEAAWLIDRAVEIIDEKEYSDEFDKITSDIREHIYEEAFDGASLPAEKCEGIVEQSRVWWVQAEAIVGFYSGYEKENNKIKYKKAIKSIWEYIKNYMIDKRIGSEWYWQTDRFGNPSNKPIVEPWKCPYHTGRMCFELIRRGEIHV